MTEKNRGYKIKIFQARWVIFVSLAVVIGSIMSFGLVGFFVFHFDRETSISMLGMILPMTLVMVCTMYVLLKRMSVRMGRLLSAIEAVAEGNLEVEIDTEKGEEYRPVYQQFNSMVRELRGTKQEMENFVNDLAHEFKTPITAISGFAEYLYQTGEGIETQERMEFLKLMADQAKRLSNLSCNTLLLSKLEACQIVTDKENFSLSEQIKECVILLLNQLEEKRITVEIPEDFEISYYGNRELMQQIWINLLSNSLKFTPEKGRICLGYRQVPGFVEISISDTGVGMDPETKEKIFQKYYQNDTQNLTKGNGIGLSIVKRIVELCKGNIRVESQPGKDSGGKPARKGQYLYGVSAPVGKPAAAEWQVLVNPCSLILIGRHRILPEQVF